MTKQASSLNGGKILLHAILVAVTFLPFLLAINLVDLDNPAIAFDWRESFHGAIWLDNFGWDTRPFRTPPWSVYFLLPFTALPFALGWATMLYITTIAMVAVVPRKPSRNLWLIGTILLLTAHPVIRNIADVNLEGFVIGGLLLSLYGFHEEKPLWLALGILIAGVKPQGVFLMYIVMGLYMLRTWNWRNIGKVIAICGGVFVLTMLIWGQAWLESLDTLPGGISLATGLSEFNLPSFAILTTQIGIALVSLVIGYLGEAKLTYLKVGLLISASVLVAPYANAVSVVPALAFGAIGLFMRRWWLGVFIFVIYNLPYLQAFGVERFTAIDTQYFLVIQLILWVSLLIEVIIDNRSTSDSIIKED
ncbi:MAG: hypothetical protein AAF846_10145 [Chloroflexota bacterium]